MIFALGEAASPLLVLSDKAAKVARNKKGNWLQSVLEASRRSKKPGKNPDLRTL